jgi:hypothetical protein
MGGTYIFDIRGMDKIVETLDSVGIELFVLATLNEH